MNVIGSNRILSSAGRSVIVITYDDASTRTINESHPNFARIGEALASGDDPAVWLDVTPSTEWFRNVYDEYRYDEDGYDQYGYDAGGYDVCGIHRDEAEDADPDYDDDEDDDQFDPEPVIESLAQTIERYRREGRDPINLVRFMGRLERNPSRRSRDQLFQWTVAKDLTIDEDGYVVGFKGVCVRTDDTPEFPLAKYPYQSSSSGHGIVDGIEIVSGNLPMGVDAVISIPREEVQDDPTIGCHVGLHVGSHGYASTFATVLIEVRFDPADVVSVPTDCGFTKLRCCRYEVMAVHDVKVGDDLTAWEPDATWDEVASLDTLVEDAPAKWFSALAARIRSIRKGGE